jgi:hypothetical protein
MKEVDVLRIDLSVGYQLFRPTVLTGTEIHLYSTA